MDKYNDIQQQAIDSQGKDAYQQQHQRETAHARCMGMFYCCSHRHLLRLSERQAV